MRESLYRLVWGGGREGGKEHQQTDGGKGRREGEKGEH